MCGALTWFMFSCNWPSTIPLYSLPYLNSQNARNGEVLVNQPTIGCHTLPDDKDEEEEGEADAEADRDSEGLGGANYHPATTPTHTHSVLACAHAWGSRSSSPLSLIIKPAWCLYLYNLLEQPNSSAATVLVHIVVTALIVFSALVNRHPSNTSPANHFHSLDHALAVKYIHLVMAHCQRVAATQSHGGEIMHPRCVFSFLSLCLPLTFLPAWKYVINLNPALLLLHLNSQASRKRILVTDAINRQNDHPPSTTLFAPLGGHLPVLFFSQLSSFLGLFPLTMIVGSSTTSPLHWVTRWRSCFCGLRCVSPHYTK